MGDLLFGRWKGVDVVEDVGGLGDAESSAWGESAWSSKFEEESRSFR